MQQIGSAGAPSSTPATSGNPLVSSTTGSSSSISTSKASTTSTGGATLGAAGAAAANLILGATLTSTWTMAGVAAIALIPGVAMLWL
jgi:hypothetical protein